MGQPSKRRAQGRARRLALNKRLPDVLRMQHVAIRRGRLRFRTMQIVDETLIVEAGRRLAAAAPDSQVILFGSHARGEANPQSDVDFLVVKPEVANEAEESVRLHRTLRDLRVPADVIVVSREYAERWREVRGGLVHAALSQGRVLAG